MVDPATGSRGVVHVPATLLVTVVVSLLGWAGLAGLERLTRYGTRICVGLAVAVVAVSMFPVVAVGATATTKAALVVVHLVVGAALVPAFVRARR